MVRLGDVFVWLAADWRASVCWLRADPMNPPLRGVVPPDRLSAMPPVRAFTPAAPRPVPAESAPGAVPPAADATSSPSRPASKRAAYQAKLDDYSAKIKKYDAEKEDIQRTAHELEAKRDDAQRHGQPMGLAVIFLQIAILLSSVAGLFKRRELWLCALPLGLLGLVLFANGFLLFLPPLL